MIEAGLFEKKNDSCVVVRTYVCVCVLMSSFIIVNREEKPSLLKGILVDVRMCVQMSPLRLLGADLSCCVHVKPVGIVVKQDRAFNYFMNSFEGGFKKSDRKPI